MTKRTEVKINGGQGAYYWAPAKILGEEDDMFIVEYRDIFGGIHEGMFYPQVVRHVDAEITDELLQEAANAAIRQIREHVLMIEDEVLEAAGRDVLHSLRLRFMYPT
jgi:hypothetical protein